MARPKNPKKPVKIPKGKTALPDVLEDKYCIAREHLDRHIESWTDEERFERLENAHPKTFDTKVEAEEYVEQFKDVTEEFADHAMTPVVVIPLKRILAHSYSITLTEGEGGVLRPEIEVNVSVKGKGTPWKQAVENARAPYVDQVSAAVGELDAFLEQRLAEEKALEARVKEAKAVLEKLDKSLKQFVTAG